MSSTEEIPLAEKAKTIKAINRDTVHKICSGQVNGFVFCFFFSLAHYCGSFNCLFVGRFELSNCCKRAS